MAAAAPRPRQCPGLGASSLFHVFGSQYSQSPPKIVHVFLLCLGAGAIALAFWSVGCLTLAAIYSYGLHAEVCHKKALNRPQNRPEMPDPESTYCPDRDRPISDEFCGVFQVSSRLSPFDTDVVPEQLHVSWRLLATHQDREIAVAPLQKAEGRNRKGGNERFKPCVLS